MYTCPACGWRSDDHEVTWRVDGVETTWASSYCPICGQLIDSEDDDEVSDGQDVHNPTS
ncbi:MAG TPA: hypothetical protein VMV29_22350 [Ktedonobacterales bacterium]|nr:hypothetical protein [Ktedonobacterales bacterium]